MQRHEAEGTIDHPTYQAAITILNYRHVCRLDTWPPPVMRSLGDWNMGPYEAIQGPNEFCYTGSIRDKNWLAELHRIHQPALVLCGQHDELTPACSMKIHAALPNSRIKVFPNSSHLPMYEEPEAYFEDPAGFPRRPSRIAPRAGAGPRRRNTTMNASEKRAALAGAIREGQFVVAPGVYDMISAKVADGMGFRALYMTGYGVAASHLGLPDAGIASYADVVSRVRTIAGGTASPLICDADTGFGGLLNVRHTVRGYEDAGCSAIQLEDQEIPKKCGHTPGRRVVPVEDMVEKIRVAADARSDPNFLIIARTDARTSLGLDEALARGQAFADAGADVIFIEAPENEDEIARIGETFDKPLLANMVDSGKDPHRAGGPPRGIGFQHRDLSRHRHAAGGRCHEERLRVPQARRLHRQRRCADDLAARDARADGLRGRLGLRAPLGPARGRGGGVDAGAPLGQSRYNLAGQLKRPNVGCGLSGCFPEIALGWRPFDEVPPVAILVREYGHRAVLFVSGLLSKLDTPAHVSAIVAPKVIRRQKQEYASTRLIANRSDLALAFCLGQQETCTGPRRNQGPIASLLKSSCPR